MSRKINPDQTDLFEADTKSYRYVMVLDPGFHIGEKVKFFRQKLHAFYPVSDEEMRSKPHITLCHFDSRYNCDKLIIDKTKQASAKVKAFDFSVNGLNYWDSGTLYMKVEAPLPVLQLLNNLKAELKSAKLSTHPHITIVRKLKKQHYAELQKEDFDYQASSRCYTITILKQLLDDKPQAFEILERIKLR